MFWLGRDMILQLCQVRKDFSLAVKKGKMQKLMFWLRSIMILQLCQVRKGFSLAVKKGGKCKNANIFLFPIMHWLDMIFLLNCFNKNIFCFI